MTAEEFVDRVLERFPPYRWDEPAEASYAEDAIRELGAFDAKVLERGFRDLIRTRKKPGIPAIADLIAVCAEARRWMKIEAEKSQLPLVAAETSPEWSKERVKLAYDLCRTDLGKRAAKEGWAYRLWTYCRIERKHPAPVLCDQFKREAAEHQQLVEACIRGEGGYFSEHLGKYGQSMIDREAKKAGEITSK